MTGTVPAHSDTAPAHPRKSIYMVLGCTVFAATAQVLMKFGMAHTMPPFQLGDSATWLPLVIALITDIPLMLGFFAHSLNALFLILALRDGELSMLYPIIALTYVWVTLLSYWLLHDSPNWYKNAGIAIIVLGVAILGQGGERK